MIDTTTALEARANLDWIASKWGELKNRLRKTGGDPNAPRVTGSSEKPAPIDLHVSDLMHEITTHAVFLGRVLIDETDWRQERGEMPGLLIDVATQYGHFVCADEKTAWDFCDQAHELRRKVEGVLAGKERARYVGPCPESGCDGELYMRDVEGGGQCPVCGEPWTLPSQWAWLRAEAEGVIMEKDVLRAALVSMGYDVPGETIRTWVKRKKIREPEPELFSFGDALALAKARGERKVSVR